MFSNLEERRLCSKQITGKVRCPPSERTFIEWLVGISTCIHTSIYPLSIIVEINEEPNMACYYHHHLHLLESQKKAGEWESFIVKNGKTSSMLDERLLAWEILDGLKEARCPMHLGRGADLTFSIWS